MKKIIFMLFTALTFVNNVCASEWTEEELTGDNVEKEYRYRLYKEEKEGEYVRLGLDSNYKYEDAADIYYGEYMDYYNDCPSGEGYDKLYSTKYKYKKYLPVKFVKICNLSDSDFTLKHMKFYNLVDEYTFYYKLRSCTKCQNNQTTINPGGCLIVEMNNEAELDDFTFNLIIDDNGNNGNFELVYSKNYNYSTTDIVAFTRGNTSISYYTYDDSFYLYPNYTQTMTDYDIEIDKLTLVSSEEKICRAREIKTYRYNIAKKYYDDNYYKDVTDLTNLTKEEQSEYKKDEKDYKIYYRYINTTEEDIKAEEIINDKNKYDNKLNDKPKLVKTGIEVKNYNYLIIFILFLILIALFFIKRIKTMSIEKDN